MTGARPAFTDMSRDESIELLRRHGVGRLAFTFHDRVDIEPISYVYDEGWLYGRTSPGTKLTTVQHHPWVALQVDEIDGRFDWRSVVVRGAIFFLDAERGEAELATYERAVEVLRAADADAFTESDATPHRQSVFRIHADQVTGRRAAPETTASSTRRTP
jgi:nitroimidazol reductase NimA-like FMN-containing flavoprotein (pyridoxamine 5'-phosphate oxidase superfamily)